MKSSLTGGIGQAGTPSTQVNQDRSIDENSSAERGDQNKPVIKPREKDNTGLQWGVVPTDIIFRIFESLMQQVFQGSGQSRASALNALVQFGSASASQLGHLQEFLKDYPDVNQLRIEIDTLKRSEWRQQAVDLKKNSGKLREEFSSSASVLAEWSKSSDSSNSSSAAYQLPPLQGVEQFEGIQINCKTFHWRPEMKSSISVLAGKVVKLDAKAVGRERFLNEILPVLKALPENCPIVLDVSNNGLLPEDLGQLVELMKVKPSIYRFDLSGNPVVEPNEASAHIATFFAETGPLTHLYLENTGFNDATAQSLKNILPDADLLEHLDLRNNPMSETGIIDIIRATFDADSNTFDYSKPPPRLAHSLRVVRFPVSSHSFGDDLGVAVNSFINTLQFFQMHEVMRSDEFDKFDLMEVIDPRIFELVDPRRGMGEDSARVEALNNFYQNRADKDRL